MAEKSGRDSFPVDKQGCVASYNQESDALPYVERPEGQVAGWKTSGIIYFR